MKVAYITIHKTKCCKDVSPLYLLYQKCILKFSIRVQAKWMLEWYWDALTARSRSNTCIGGVTDTRSGGRGIVQDCKKLTLFLPRPRPQCLTAIIIDTYILLKPFSTNNCFRYQIFWHPLGFYWTKFQTKKVTWPACCSGQRFFIFS